MVLDLSPADTVSAAADAGFDAAGIWFDAGSWSARDDARGRGRACSRPALTALDVEPVFVSERGDAGDMLIDVAGELGARNVLLVQPPPATAAATIDRYGELCDRAAPAGIKVVLEFLPIMSVDTLAAAVEVVTAAARPNSGILVDTLHLSRAGSSPADLQALDRALFPYLQLADAPDQPPGTSSTELRDEALVGPTPARRGCAPAPSRSCRPYPRCRSRWSCARGP